MTINELIEKAHAQAKEKGFWDQERNTGELLMLIVSECGEALEAHRKGRVWGLAEFDQRPDSMTFDEKFQACIKDGFADELADIVIRIADLMGHVEYGPSAVSPGPNIKRDGNVGEALFTVVGMIAQDGVEGLVSLCRALNAALIEVFGIANAHDIDLWRHIELKLAYNATRPRLHGKQY